MDEVLNCVSTGAVPLLTTAARCPFRLGTPMQLHAAVITTAIVAAAALLLQASSAKVAEQVQFLNDSMASSTADWDIVLGA